MFTIEDARKLLNAADVFYDADDEDDENIKQTLNMNDTWGWAMAMGEYVPDEKLPEVALLFWQYGFAGLLYWVSEQNGGMRSEFPAYNRHLDFVKNEQKMRKKFTESSKWAYAKTRYKLG